MYEKLTTRLRKGYRLLKISSKSLRKCSRTIASASQKLHQSNQCDASPVAKDGGEESNTSSLSLSHKDEKPPECEVALVRKLSACEDRWQSIFDNDLYKNWLRVGLALRKTCDAVAPLVDTLLMDFQLELRDKYSAIPTAKSQDIIREVLKLHKRPISKAEVWKRSDVNMWLEAGVGPWEIAKVYIPRGSWGSSRLTTAKSLDITGMFNLMMSFKPFENYISNLEQVQRVIQIRNRTMHNPRLEFTKDELETCFNGIQTLLQDGVLNLYLSEYPGFETSVDDIEKMKTMDFNLAATIKSSFEVLEERLATDKHSDLPSPLAMSSNRELLRSLRRVFSSGEVAFTVDTESIQENLEGLEELLSEQQILAEEKITMLFRKVNYLQLQLDRIRGTFTSGGALPSFYQETPDAPSRQEQIVETNSHQTTSGSATNRKRKRKGRKRGGKVVTSSHILQNSQSKTTRKGGSKITISLRKSKSSVKSKRENLSRARSAPGVNQKILKVFNTSSGNTLLYPGQGMEHKAKRLMSSSNCSDGHDEASTSHNEAKSAWASDSFIPNGCDKDNAGNFDDGSDVANADVPGPSGLQSKNANRKRVSSTSLVPREPIKKKLMVPPPTTLTSKKDNEVDSSKNSVNQKRLSDSSLAKGSTFSAGGGSSSGEGHFQQILRGVIKEQSSSVLPVYEDKKEGQFYISTVRVQSKYAVKSREPKPTAAAAEIGAAAEALKRLGFVVADKEAKSCLNRFCEAAVDTSPSYFSFAAPYKLHVSVVQLHSRSFAWVKGVKDRGIRVFPGSGISKRNILLQVKSEDSADNPKEVMEQNCARVALTEANISQSEISNAKRSVNELCLRQGGTLPIYETIQCDKTEGISKSVTTMTSLLPKQSSNIDASADTDSLSSSNCFTRDSDDDILTASSPQPANSQVDSEELAAKVLLEKMGIVVGEAALETFKKPYSQILRENAVNRGYHEPQYHTWCEVKAVADIGEMHFAVVSSRAFRKFTESLSAESDQEMTTIRAARESAAKKALLMLGYPQTFHSAK